MTTAHGVDRSGTGPSVGAPDPSAFAQTILDDQSAAEVLATLLLDADLATFSVPANTTISAFIKDLLDDANAAAALVTLGAAADANTVHISGTETVTGDKTFSGVVSVRDSFLITGSGDQTKKVRIEADGVTAGQTRTWNAPDRDISPGKFPTQQRFTSGSGTYTTPSGCIYIRVRLVGGGAGGSGRDANNGGAGSNTTFSTFTAGGGTGGTAGGAGGTGGSASGGDINIPGGGGAGAIGNSSASVAPTGGVGGNSVFGGAGAGTLNTTGGSAATNSGGGGAGAGGTNSVNSGAGGGAGGYVEALITSPAATYSYAVGAGGSGGAAGGQAGGSGAAGIIIVDEFYA